MGQPGPQANPRQGELPVLLQRSALDHELPRHALPGGRAHLASDVERHHHATRRHGVRREEVLVDLHAGPRMASHRGQPDTHAVGLPVLQRPSQGRDGPEATAVGSPAVGLFLIAPLRRHAGYKPNARRIFRAISRAMMISSASTRLRASPGCPEVGAVLLPRFVVSEILRQGVVDRSHPHLVIRHYGKPARSVDVGAKLARDGR